jgi:hypothetical protein
MRTFIFFNQEERDRLDYSQLVETSRDTLRVSLDGINTFVSYETEAMPDTIQALTSYIGPLTYEETLTILQTAAWLPPAPTT